MQRRHMVAPDLELYVPTPQLTHAAAFVLPKFVFAVPAGHLVHSVVPGLFEYVPAVHCWQ